ncbi:FAD-dependent oxidoreductase [Actinomadura sp. KC216]|uniref:FAD-dependent oxidoreductase n=1 Tax=Actinomadura sp. KC216 TaxID=2530370 RepID=UPI001404D65E|nr:FAD-dependent oxidoreductase [Actinomadura sp. KC216]
MSPDGLPIIDGSAGPQGLVLVTGLSGHGLTIGPVIGRITADLALKGRTDRPIEAFRLSRFADDVMMPEKMI